MSEWRPEEVWEKQVTERLKDLGFDAMHTSLETKEYYRNIYEAGADAIVVALMGHLRATAKQNLDLAQSIINEDNALAGTIPWQLGRDATAYLVVADYIEKGQIRPWGMDDITANVAEKESV